MKKEDVLGDLLSSFVKGEKHAVRIRVDTAFTGSMAIQYKLLRLLRKNDFNDRDFVRMLLICGLAEVSRNVLKDLLSVKGITYGMMKKLFDEFEKAI